MASKESRKPFKVGEAVKIAGKSTVVDKERAHEGIPEGAPRVPIEENVTGFEGTIQDGGYYSPERGEYMHRVEVSPSVNLSVPESRIERDTLSRRAVTGGIGNGRSGVLRGRKGRMTLDEITKAVRDLKKEARARRAKRA